MRALLLVLLFSASFARAEALFVLTEAGQRLEFDATHVQDIAYVQAGRGAGLASRFGHSLLRISFCPSAPPCADDQVAAFDFGFAAQTLGGSFSAVGGIVGKYPSVLTVKSALESDRIYLYEDLRDVIVAPLDLSGEEKVALLRAFVAAFFEPQSNYKFLSNNCAVQMLRLLESVLPDADLREIDLEFLTPHGLLKGLLHAKRVALQDIEVKTSRRTNLDGFVHGFRVERPRMFVTNVDAYARIAAKYRLQWITAKANTIAQAYQWELLEEFAQKRAHSLFVKSAFAHLAADNTPLVCGEDRGELLAQMATSFAALSVQALRDLAPEEIFARFKTQHEVVKRIEKCMAKEPALSGVFGEVVATELNLQKIGSSQ